MNLGVVIVCRRSPKDTIYGRNLSVKQKNAFLLCYPSLFRMTLRDVDVANEQHKTQAELRAATHYRRGPATDFLDPQPVFEVDQLASLGVPEDKIEWLRRADRYGRSMSYSKPPNRRLYLNRANAIRERKAARSLALIAMAGIKKGTAKWRVSTEEALRRVGYSHREIRDHFGSVIRSLSNSPYFMAELAKVGVGPKLIAALIREGIDQTQPLRGAGNEIVTDADGQPVAVPDHHTRLAYIDRAMEISGAAFVPDKNDAPVVNVQLVNLMSQIDSMPAEQRQRIAHGDLSEISAPPPENNTDSAEAKGGGDA